MRITVNGRDREVFIKHHLLEGEWNIGEQKAAKWALKAKTISELFYELHLKLIGMLLI